MHTEKSTACSKCGHENTPPPRSGTNQPVRMGDLFLTMQAAGNVNGAAFVMQRILDHDKAKREDKA